MSERCSRCGHLQVAHHHGAGCSALAVTGRGRARQTHACDCKAYVASPAKPKPDAPTAELPGVMAPVSAAPEPLRAVTPRTHGTTLNALQAEPAVAAEMARTATIRGRTHGDSK